MSKSNRLYNALAASRLECRLVRQAGTSLIYLTLCYVAAGITLQAIFPESINTHVRPWKDTCKTPFQAIGNIVTTLKHIQPGKGDVEDTQPNAYRSLHVGMLRLALDRLLKHACLDPRFRFHVFK